MRHLSSKLTIIIITTLTFIFLCGWSNNTRAQSLGKQNISENSQVEQFILEKVANGESVNLNEFSLEDRDHLINGVFLENLLSGRLVDIPRKGVSISNFEVQGLLDLENAQINSDVNFSDCKFTKPVSFEQATIKGLDFSSAIMVEGEMKRKTKRRPQHTIAVLSFILITPYLPYLGF